jgi:hypothetical protein
MKQAIESFFIADGEGGETFVPKGKVLPDNHPHALGAPLQFEDLALDEVPEPPPAKRGGLGRPKAS